MKGYKVVAVLWEDHVSRIGAQLPLNPDEAFEVPTLTVGILLRETEKSLLIAHDVERLEDIDNSTYTVLLKTAVVGVKEYGQIEIEGLRWKEA
jgi:hypothetical protein